MMELAQIARYPAWSEPCPEDASLHLTATPPPAGTVYKGFIVHKWGDFYCATPYGDRGGEVVTLDPAVYPDKHGATRCIVFWDSNLGEVGDALAWIDAQWAHLEPKRTVEKGDDQ
jgi:hypothetical protein